MSLSILAIATIAPPGRMPQKDAAEAMKSFSCRNEREGRLLSVIFQKSEVHTRSSVILQPPGVPICQDLYSPMAGPDDHGPTTAQRMERYAREAPLLGLQAARQALANSGVAAERITHLITVTCTGFHAPGIDVSLIKQLDLRPTVQRVQIGFMGCHGAINGLRVAQAFAAADPDARILLCAVELCSLHFYYGWDVDKVKANALFADGAGALVAGAPATGGSPCWHVADTGSCLLPDSEDAMTWRIGNNGFEMTLSPRVPELIQAYLRPWLSEWLSRHDLSLGDVNSWAVHPGGPRIVSSVAELLQLSEASIATSRSVLAEYGNMSSPTLLFILDRLRREGARLPCVALGFGPGLIAEVALLTES
jgi:predicted naringenin-chalcone synthase